MKEVKCQWPLVSIHWTDAFDGENGWTEIESYKAKEATVMTVGWLWANCLPGYVTVVNSYFPDEVPDMKTVGMPIHIPVGMVVDIVVLEQASAKLPEENETKSK